MTSILENNKYPPLRAIRVTYSTGHVEITDMAAHLTDQQMLDYFRIGRQFNLGENGRDLMAYVTKSEILK